jgi:8-oxo-dGTP diphosphatase
MKHYTLGFLFNLDCSRVLLICKNRPDWQAGRYNGIGGRIETERDESSEAAMAREFREETNLYIAEHLWEPFSVMHSRGDTVYCFAHASLQINRAVSVTDEPVHAFFVDHLPEACLPNLHWLIPLAINKLTGRDPLLVSLETFEMLKGEPVGGK